MSNRYNTLVLTDKEFGNNLYTEVANVLRILMKAVMILICTLEMQFLFGTMRKN